MANNDFQDMHALRHLLPAEETGTGAPGHIKLEMETKETANPTIHVSTAEKYLPSKGFNATNLLTGWRFTLGSGALVGEMVLIINLGTLIIIFTQYSLEDETATIYTGSCVTAGRTVTALHLLINVLSTLLLAASNSSMQCLSSPTREEVDRAHANHQWLSIGTPTIRNLRYVSRVKALLWLLIGLSSFPLHFLWNSTVFQTIATNEYIVVSATETFVQGAPWSLDLPTSDLTHAINDVQSQAQRSLLERLENVDCMSAYIPQIQSSRRNLVLIMDYHNDTVTSSVTALYRTPFTLSSESYAWMTCNYGDEDCGFGGSNWKPYNLALRALPGETGPCYVVWELMQCGNPQNASVKYCLSESVKEQCKVSMVPLFLAIVVVCNLLKTVAFIWTLRITQRDPPLITTGDAVASFITRPDMNTRGRCLAEKADYQEHGTRSGEWVERPPGVGDTWTGGRPRWARSVQAVFWWTLVFGPIAGILIAGLSWGGFGANRHYTSISAGIGGRGYVGRSSVKSVLGNTNLPLRLMLVLASAPQAIASYCYLIVNNVSTSMLAMKEWTNFARDKPKGLRVSRPVAGSQQRSTYFLSVPLRWAVPIITMFALLHWLCSEMLLAVCIEVYTSSGILDSSRSVKTLYFNGVASLIVIGLTSSLLAAIVLLAVYNRFPAGATLAGCCSASIAAACQPDDETESFDAGLHLKKVQWGVTKVPRGIGDVGHATFTDWTTGRLVEGMLYA